jgi:hemolysin activation/secretion protein
MPAHSRVTARREDRRVNTNEFNEGWGKGASRRRLAGAGALLMTIACQAAHAVDAPAAAAPASAPAAAKAPAPQGPAFDILEYEVAGNTVLTVAAIEAAVEPFLGPGRRMDDVEAARAALEAAYQKAGYLTVGVDVPEQRIADGVVRLAVIEGRVHSVYVTGSKYHSQDWIRTRVAALAPGGVPDFNRVQAQLGELNRTDDRRVQPVLKPGRLPGTVDVDLQVTDALPVSGSVELNNQHSRDTTPTRLLGSVRYDNLGQRDESLSLTAQVAPQKPSESEVLIANWSRPLDADDTLAWNLVLSNSDVDTLGGTQVLGKGVTLGARWQHPVGFEHGYWSLQAGADFKDQRQRTQFGSSQVSTPLRYLPFQLSAYGQWASGADRVSFNLSGTFALGKILQRDVPCPSATGTTMQDQFSCAHYGSDGSFALARGDLRLSHRFAGGESLGLRAAAQLASEPLVSGEQFSLGGFDTVRGYYEGEAAGDEGGLLSLEARSRSLGPLLLSKGAADRVKDLSTIGFLDAGLAHNIQPAVGQQTRIPLWSVGTGLRLDLRDGLEGQLDLAWPQKGVPGRLHPDMRVHARVAWRF